MFSSTPVGFSVGSVGFSVGITLSAKIRKYQHVLADFLGKKHIFGVLFQKIAYYTNLFGRKFGYYNKRRSGQVLDVSPNLDPHTFSRWFHVLQCCSVAV